MIGLKFLPSIKCIAFKKFRFDILRNMHAMIEIYLKPMRAIIIFCLKSFKRVVFYFPRESFLALTKILSGEINIFSRNVRKIIFNIVTKKLVFINELIRKVYSVICRIVLKFRNILQNIILVVKTRLSSLRAKITKFIFGPLHKLGTYEKENPDRLLYPIIILNGKLLLELDTDREKTLEKFFRVFEEICFVKSSSLFEIKLKELLNGKNFPIESFHVPKRGEDSIQGTYIYLNKYIPMDCRYRRTELPADFGLNIYKISQEHDYKNFLNYLLGFYFRFNIWFKDEIGDGDFWFESNEINNLFMTFDLSPFIIYQEQANSFANCLEKQFKEEIDYRNKLGNQTTFGCWFEKLIKELRHANLPSEKDKSYWTITFFCLSPFFPFFWSLFVDFCGYLVFGHYGLCFIGIVLAIIFRKCNRLIYCDNLWDEIKEIYCSIIKFLNENYKKAIVSYLLSQLNPVLSRLISPLKILFGMFPVISSHELNFQAKLYVNNLHNSIKLCLSGQYLNNLSHATRHFKNELKTTSSPKMEILRGVGLSMQEVRGSNPRLFNHSFLKQYRFIYLNKLTDEQKKVILSRLSKSLELSIQGTTEIPLEWYNSMNLGDID
jgi:hypothetical protein